MTDNEGAALPLAVRLWKAVEDRYDLFPAADGRRVFAVPKSGGPTELVNGPFVVRATWDIGQSEGRLTFAANRAARMLTVLAALNEPRRVGSTRLDRLG